MFQGGCAPAITRCVVAARARFLEGKSFVGRPGGCLGHPGPGRAGGRCGTLVLTEGWRSTRRPGPQGTSPFSSFGWRLLQKISAQKSIERCSRFGIKASSPCGQHSEHIGDILKTEKLILSMEQRSTLTSLRPSPRHAATMLLTGAAFPVHALAFGFSWYMPIEVLRQKTETACAPCHAMK